MLLFAALDVHTISPNDLCTEPPKRCFDGNGACLWSVLHSFTLTDEGFWSKLEAQTPSGNPGPVYFDSDGMIRLHASHTKQLLPRAAKYSALCQRIG